jgi:hypothetical protein
VPSALEAIGGAGQPSPENWAAVLAMHGFVHHKPGAPPSFRVNYRTDVGWISDFLPLQHPSSGARWHAGNKWKQLARNQQTQPPLSAVEADARFRSGELRQPARVLVQRDGEWWRIKAAEFAA